MEHANQRERAPASSAHIFTEDFVSDDRRTLVGLGRQNAEEFWRSFALTWDLGRDGQPTHAVTTLATCGDRGAAMRFRTEYPTGDLIDTIHILFLDASLSLLQSYVVLDGDQETEAVAVLEGLHRGQRL